MQNKRNTGGSKALRVLAVIIGALMTLVGMLSASGDMDKILEGIGVGGDCSALQKRWRSRCGIIPRLRLWVCCSSAACSTAST